MNKQFKKIVFDVDGVFTTGQFLYTEAGKFAKVFGPHDNDGIKMIKKYLKVEAITADKRGYNITQKRIESDMGIKLSLVSEEDRPNFFLTDADRGNTIYMGDGIHDIPIFKLVGYSIAPANAFHLTRESANFVTSSRSGEGAVAEACFHIIETFFNSPILP